MGRCAWAGVSVMIVSGIGISFGFSVAVCPH